MTLATGKPLGAPPTDHIDAVLGVAFNPDSALLASASADGTVQSWDTATR
jgi:WD40 repeat protein